MAWLTLLRGDTSTACRLTVPARPIRVESSRGPLLVMASTRTWRGFCGSADRGCGGAGFELVLTPVQSRAHMGISFQPDSSNSFDKGSNSWNPI